MPTGIIVLVLPLPWQKIIDFCRPLGIMIRIVVRGEERHAGFGLRCFRYVQWGGKVWKSHENRCNAICLITARPDMLHSCILKETYGSLSGKWHVMMDYIYEIVWKDQQTDFILKLALGIKCLMHLGSLAHLLCLCFGFEFQSRFVLDWHQVEYSGKCA